MAGEGRNRSKLLGADSNRLAAVSAILRRLPRLVESRAAGASRLQRRLPADGRGQDGFAGAHEDPGRAAFRPTGLAIGPDGALYVSDDVHGRIWRVTYHGGDATAQLAPAPHPVVAAASANSPLPPEGTHPDDGRQTGALPVPPGATREQVALGDRIFHGEASDGTCSGCHGSDAGGTSVGPPLNNSIWVQSDGSLASIAHIIDTGMPRPRN
jgi:mono/diheme cytochrome c family protein